MDLGLLNADPGFYDARIALNSMLMSHGGSGVAITVGETREDTETAYTSGSQTGVRGPLEVHDEFLGGPRRSSLVQEEGAEVDGGGLQCGERSEGKSN